MKVTGMCFLTAAMALLILLATQTAALMPYRASLFDLIPSFEDPFKVLEQASLAIPKSAETVALAHCDWKETPTAHVITVDVPGLGKDDVKIEVEEDNRVLRINGERKAEEEVEGDIWHRTERTVGRFWRRFRMPANADVEGIRARLENGLLRVTVPKLGEEKKRQPKLIGIEEGGKGEDVKAAATKTTRDEM